MDLLIVGILATVILTCCFLISAMAVSSSRTTQCLKELCGRLSEENTAYGIGRNLG